MPTGRAVVVRTAVRPLSGTVPRLVLPFSKVTEPVGVPGCADTVAVRVTDCPNMEGFSEDVNVAVELALPTVWLTAAEVLLAKFASPPYTAVIESVPSGSDVVVRLATPPVNVAVPSEVVPLKNATLSPSGGAPPLDVTVAVNITGSAYMDGLGVGAGVSVVVVFVVAGAGGWYLHKSLSSPEKSLAS